MSTAHGLRSSFKDWARDEGLPEMLAEFALAPRRGLEDRGRLRARRFGREAVAVMQAWSGFVLAAGD